MFETYIVQPIFNVLLMLYALVGDFGVAIIIFTILIRLLMWPLLKKQLHQGRVIRKIQPEIKQIRKKNKGDRQKEARELGELYKKHGISTFGSLGLLFIQLPVFFGLFSALRSVIDSPERIIRMPYEFVANNSSVQEMVATITEKTNEALATLGDTATTLFNSGVASAESLRGMSKEELEELYNSTLASQDAEGITQELVQGPFFEQELFGVIDLSGQALGDAGVYIPVLIIAVLAGVFQFFQTRQLMPKDTSNKTIREIMKEAAASGKEPDQSEISAAMNKRLGLFFAPLITLISATSPAGLALYFATGGLIGLLQARTVIHEDVEEMELVADVIEDTEKAAKKKKTNKKKQASKKSKSTKKKR